MDKQSIQLERRRALARAEAQGRKRRRRGFDGALVTNLDLRMRADRLRQLIG